MTVRALFWIGVFIAISAVVSLYSVERASIARVATQHQKEFENQQIESMRTFLGKQQDGRKLIGLAKRLPKENTQLIKMTILRAFELEPNSRDISILASTYSSAAKKRIQEIDPLYNR